MMKQYLQSKIVNTASSTSAHPVAPVFTAPAVNNNRTTCRVVTVCCQWDPSSTDSIPIDNIHLNGESTMKDILTFRDSGYPSFNDKNDLEMDDHEGKNLSFHIKVDNGNDNFIFKKWRFLKMKLDDIHSLENVKSPISISIVMHD